MITSTYCSALSRSSGEQLFGTAKHAAVWLLLETPGAWPKAALDCPTIPREVTDHLLTLEAQGRPVRCLAVRPLDERTPTRKCFIAFCDGTNPVLYSMQVAEYHDLLSLDLGRVTSGRDPRAVAEPGSLYAVCAHGSHDRCCGTYGGRTYAAAKSAGVSALQASHVGGCRFAPNVLCLPAGLLYGYVSEDEVTAIVRGHESGQIHLDRYRGRTCYAKPAQVAEFFLRRETGVLGYRDIACRDWTETSPGQWLTRFCICDGEEFEVIHRRAGEPLLVMHKCGSTEPRYHHQHECLGVRRISSVARPGSAPGVTAATSKSW
jgi:hypothetical protein